MKEVAVDLTYQGRMFRSWPAAYSMAHSAAALSGYRYRVRADRAHPGRWLVSRGPRRVRVEGER